MKKKIMEKKLSLTLPLLLWMPNALTSHTNNNVKVNDITCKTNSGNKSFYGNFFCLYQNLFNMHESGLPNIIEKTSKPPKRDVSNFQIEKKNPKNSNWILCC